MNQLLQNIELGDIGNLLDAIANNSAIIYVGAGASYDSSMPLWGTFLQDLLKEYQHTVFSDEQYNYIRRKLDFQDYVTCAQYMQRHEKDAKILKYISKIYGRKNAKPTAIHQAIARIPFKMAITTNYDSLLEKAYGISTSPLTWKNSSALYSHLKSDNFIILKTHGDAHLEDAILSKRDYRKIIYENAELNACISHLLMFNTFLFVGSSITDPDLISLMDNLKSIHKEGFGPHYAIVIGDESASVHVDFLRDSYNIETIKCLKPNIESDNWKTEAVVSTLTNISGRVSSKNLVDTKITMVKSPTFFLKDACLDIIKELVLATGSMGGYIAYTSDLNRHELREVCKFQQAGDRALDLGNYDEDHTDFTGKLVVINSFIGQFFLLEEDFPQYAYDGNVGTHSSDQDSAEFPLFLNSYKAEFSKCKSVLAYQIRADGQRIGVLVLESSHVDAYTAGHLVAAKKSSIAAAATYVEYKHRQSLTNSIEPFLAKMSEFCKLMNLSRELARLELQYLLYKIDHLDGIIEAFHDIANLTPRRFYYKFNDPSLVTSALKKQKRLLDNTNDKEPKYLAQNGVKYFNISGPVAAIPIKVNGNISSILVIWSQKDNILIKPALNEISIRAHLITNSVDRDTEQQFKKRISYLFLKELNKALGPKVWTTKHLFDKDFRNKRIDRIFELLTGDFCKIGRIRLWQLHEDNSGEYFCCTQSLSSERAKYPNTDSENHYVGIRTIASDPYVSHLKAVSSTKPFTMYYDMSIMGIIDHNTKVLNKDPEGSWLVCPIVHRGRLLGHISADNHIPTKNRRGYSPKEEVPSRRTSDFQRLALDLVSDIFITLLRFEQFEKKYKSEIATMAKRIKLPLFGKANN